MTDLKNYKPGFDQEVTAGGKVAFTLGDPAATAPKICFGSGAPTLSAPQGSLYLRTNGGANTRAYVNTNGTTGWTGLASS